MIISVFKRCCFLLPLVFALNACSANEPEPPVFNQPSIHQIALQKKQILTEPTGNLTVLHPNKTEGAHLAMLSGTQILRLNASDYSTIASTPASQCQDCNMLYRAKFIYDENDNLQIVIDDGVFSEDGRALWRNPYAANAGWIEVTPITLNHQTKILVEGGDINGKYEHGLQVRSPTGDLEKIIEIETNKQPPLLSSISEINVLETANGEQWPMLNTSDNRMNKFVSRLRIYDAQLNIAADFDLPENRYAQSIDWPSKGHILIDGDVDGTDFLIKDIHNQEVFRHKVLNTNIRLSGMPIGGVAVDLLGNGKPYLALISGGIVEDPYSVLLIFDHAGKLVWQEEYPRLQSIVAISAQGKREKLLVAGNKGLVELSLQP